MDADINVVVPKKRKKNRETKLHLVFDEEERNQYLSGFKKRKDERRRKAREEMETRLKEDKRRLKQEKRDMLKKMLETETSIPDVEHIVRPVIYELPNHTVTISSIADVDYGGGNNLHLGVNKDECKDSEAENKDEEQKEHDKGASKLEFRNLQRKLQKDHCKLMKTSQAMRLKQAIQKKKNRQQARRKKIFKKRDKHKGKRQSNN